MRFLYGLTAFLSAFLLFQVQPIIGRLILPWFGSTAGVWAACLLFFQATLLLGYTYAHFLVSRWPPRRQAIVHGLLLFSAVLALPIIPDPIWKPHDADLPVLRILGILSASVGMPYLVLSATGPLVLGWFARVSTETPYRLYALSNFGSLLALLSYPVWVEPNLTLFGQAKIWSIGFLVFALLCAACARILASRAGSSDGANRRTPAGPPPGWRDLALWTALAACGSALLLSTTNQLGLDVAAIPLLWVAPLAVYLLSFAICFDHDRWYLRPLFCLLLTLGVMNAVRLIAGGIALGIREQLVGYLAVLFAGCMCCHGEMARRRPTPQYLTVFFLMLAVGGVLGALAVAVAAPVFFSGSYEYSVTLVVTPALVGGTVLAERFGRPSIEQHAWRRGLALLAWCGCVIAMLTGIFLTVAPGEWISEGVSDTTREAFNLWLPGVRAATGLAIAGTILPAWLFARRTPASPPFRGRLALWLGTAAIASGSVVALAGALIWLPQPEQQLHVVRDRNFYGVLAIKNYDDGRYPRIGLKHGRIRHGVQLSDHPDWPTYYYGPNSGAGIALLHHPARALKDRPFRVGVVGLGAGTLAAYANASFQGERPGEGYAKVERRITPDIMRFYELNPMVIQWAEERFTFLRDARRRGSDIETLAGDARLVMERQLQEGRPQGFDVLVIDAFSGDAIPIHLLTRESFELYWSHLHRDGILAIDVPNRYLDVRPVIVRLAKEIGVESIYLRSRALPLLGLESAEWILLTRNQAFLADPRVRQDQRTVPDEGPLWTDDYSSVFSLLRLRD